MTSSGERSVDELQELINALTRELTEAREQQTATADVLKIISSSPGELQPVFAAMLAKATDLCAASYGAMWLREQDGYRGIMAQTPEASDGGAPTFGPWPKAPPLPH